VVVVTHELASIFTIGDNCIFLDIETRTIGGRGAPKELLAHSDNPRLRLFLTRGGTEPLGERRL
jgi:phospholipid/cholesterol/gamma-HCH transport system ATP-binding protein